MKSFTLSMDDRLLEAAHRKAMRGRIRSLDDAGPNGWLEGLRRTTNEIEETPEERRAASGPGNGRPSAKLRKTIIDTRWPASSIAGRNE